MAVLLETISVIIKRQVIESRFAGGMKGFWASAIPNQTAREDNHLVALSFMIPAEVERYITFLESSGLQFKKEDKAIDIAVVDQLHGPLVPVSWLEYRKLKERTEL